MKYEYVPHTEGNNKATRMEIDVKETAESSNITDKQGEEKSEWKQY